MYLVGEPILRLGEKGGTTVPKSQIDLCQKVLQETNEEEKIKDKLRQEYLSIIARLIEMNINFRIIYAHKDMIDKEILDVCIKYLHCGVAGFHPDYFPPSVVYPRDFSVVLPGLILVNSAVAQPAIQEKDGYLIRLSPLGEGGRVLFCDRTLLVSERLNLMGDQSSPPEIPEEVTKLGIRVGLLPPPLATRLFSGQIKGSHYFLNDHLDRVNCLIKGKDGHLYLIVDPHIETARWIGEHAYPPWKPLSTARTIALIKERCYHLGIKVRVPKQMVVPYTLNLIQLPDKRVLMTGGDEAVAETIADIVGEDNVFCTNVPIRYFPFYQYAGIRCLVCEAPLPLFKQANQSQMVQ